MRESHCPSDEHWKSSVSKAMLGKFLRDGVELFWVYRYRLKLNWSKQLTIRKVAHQHLYVCVHFQHLHGLSTNKKWKYAYISYKQESKGNITLLKTNNINNRYTFPFANKCQHSWHFQCLADQPWCTRKTTMQKTNKQTKNKKHLFMVAKIKSHLHLSDPSSESPHRSPSKSENNTTKVKTLHS